MFYNSAFQLKSKIRCCDNSGVHSFKIISLIELKNNKKLKNEMKSIITLSAKRFKKKKYRLNKKNLVNSLCIQCKANKVRFNGSKLKFDNNKSIYLDKNKKFFGTRINSTIDKQLLFSYKTYLSNNIIIFSKNKI